MTNLDEYIQSVEKYIKSVEMLIEPYKNSHDAIYTNFQLPHGGLGYDTAGGDLKEYLKNLHLNESDKKRIKSIFTQMDNVLTEIKNAITNEETELTFSIRD